MNELQFVDLHEQRTSTRYIKDLRASNRNELPAEIVCAVSPAQNRPKLGFLHNVRMTGKVLFSNSSYRLCEELTQSINHEVILHFVHVANVSYEFLFRGMACEDGFLHEIHFVPGNAVAA